MTKRMLRCFGKSKEIEKILSETRLQEQIELFCSEDMDAKIYISDTVSEENYFELCDRLENYIYADKDDSLAEVLSRFLHENKLVMATAESCTGGMVASKIIDVAGASEIFHEGIVSYSNQAKISRLYVDADLIATKGAVSEEVGREMARGLMSEYVDLGVSTTGLAGPTGETNCGIYKPVGLVYIGVAYRNAEPEVTRFLFEGNRDCIRRCATQAALFCAYRYLRNIL